MNQKSNFTIIIFCILYSMVLGGCNGDIPLASNPTVTSFPVQIPTITSKPSPSITASITATPTLTQSANITPNDFFSFPELQVLSTPDSADSCEHLSPPQVISAANKLSLLSGRFSLCPSRSRPSVKTAMDLDEGALVSVDDKSADMVMEYAHVPVDGTISYYVMGLNSVQIEQVETNSLSYEYCENRLSLDKNDPGVLIVQDGAIACVLTTEGQIALIRVDNIYPLDTQNVGFSFAILKKP